MGSRAKRSKRVLDVDEEEDGEEGDKEEEEEEEADEEDDKELVVNEGCEGDEEEEEPPKREKHNPTEKGRHKQVSLVQEFFQEPDSGEEEAQPKRDTKRRHKALADDAATLSERERVRVSNGLGVSIASCKRLKVCAPSETMHDWHWRLMRYIFPARKLDVQAKHLPIRANRGMCVCCRRGTSLHQCQACGIALHIDCFAAYHQ